MPQHTRAVVLFGEDAKLIGQALQDCVACHYVTDLNAAVKQAQVLAHTGDAVLLSPACASFDQFRNFMHRGEVFSQLVQELS